jgi:hypothetical protein
MIWGRGSTSSSTLSNLTVPAYKDDCSQGYLLGFNEPDKNNQSNLTVAAAIALWPSLMATNRCLGSPAVCCQPTNSSAWLGQFMAQASSLGYRVDFITLHWYASPSSKSFLSLLQNLHSTYKRPIWITEMAVADWSGTKPYSVKQVLEFMNSTLPFLKNNSSYGVDRFSWKTRNTTDPYMGSSALFNPDGSLTTVGQLYATI